MRIMITGAAGGIGSTLGYYLHLKNHNLILVDNFNNGYRQNLTINGTSFGDFVELDIRNTHALIGLLHDVDVVVHLAAISSLPDCEKNVAECMSVNVAGTASVLDACRKANTKKCIFASTGAIYEGNTPEQSPFHEDLPINTKLWYPTSKWMAEEICERYRENYKMNIPVLRFFNVFGPRQDIHRPHPPLINYLVRELSASREPTLHGTGNQSRDYVHVDDVVKLIELVIDSDSANTVFNVCTGKMLSVRDILAQIQLTMKTSLQANWRESNRLWDAYGDLFSGEYPLDKKLIEAETDKFACGTFDKATNILGWQPNTDLLAMLDKTVKDILSTNA